MAEMPCEDQKFMCRDESWLVQCNRIEKIRVLCPKTCGLCSDGASGTVSIVISGVKSVGNNNAIPTLTPFDSGSSALLSSSQATPSSETVVQISSSNGFTFPVPGVVWYLVLLGTFLLVIAVGLIVIFERHHLRKLLGKKTYCCSGNYYIKDEQSENRTGGSCFSSQNATLEKLGNQSTLPFPNPPPTEGSLSKELEKSQKDYEIDTTTPLVVAQVASPQTMLENNRMHYRSLWLEAAPKPVKPVVKDLRWKDQEENRSYLPADHLTTVVSQHHLKLNQKTSEVSCSGSLSVNDEVIEAEEEAAKAEEEAAKAEEEEEAAEAGECIV